MTYCGVGFKSYDLKTKLKINTLSAGVRYIRTWKSAKTSSCQLLYQHHSSSADYARELFKPSKDLESLLLCT